MNDQNNNLGLDPTSAHSSSVAGDILADGGAIQKIETHYQTAVSVQKPRVLKDVMRACKEEAALSGELFYYRWAISNKGKAAGYIQGPSFPMAVSCARNFGNCAIVQRPVIETRKAFIFTAAFVDHETGFTYERTYRMDKGHQVHGKMDQFRKDDVRYQIGQSKAIRNAVLNAMPVALIDAMLDEAMNSVREKVQARLRDCGGEIEQLIIPLLTQFGEFNVDQKMLEDRLEKVRELWHVDELVTLAGDYKALKRREETVDTLYGATQGDHDGADNTEKEKTTKPNPDPNLNLKNASKGDKNTHTGPGDEQTFYSDWNDDDLNLGLKKAEDEKDGIKAQAILKEITKRQKAKAKKGQ